MIQIVIPFNKINSVVAFDHKLCIFTDFGAYAFGTNECEDKEDIISLTTDQSLFELRIEIMAYIGTGKRRYIYIKGENNENIPLDFEVVE